jgi:tRNA (guanine-N7-)-methyltransferase
VNLDTRPLPADLWRTIFENDRPVSVEIGPGRGEFLVEMATANPGRNFFAIERAGARLSALLDSASRAGVQNVRVLRGDAACILALLPDACVETYYVQFPDPWWKRRHHRRRLWTPAFVALLARTLLDGGAIEFATDVAEYFDTALSLLRSEPRLEETAASEPVGSTSFARKARQRGAVIHCASFRRRPR